MVEELVLGALGAGATGGILGILGSLLGVGSKWLMRREERKARKDEIEYELSLIEAQMKQAGRAFEHELAIAGQAGQFEVFNSAIQSESKLRSGYPWVEAVRSLFRPFLTVFLWVMSYLVFKDIASGTASNGAIAFAADIYFAAGNATGFWFGDRAFTPKHER